MAAQGGVLSPEVGSRLKIIRPGWTRRMYRPLKRSCQALGANGPPNISKGVLMQGRPDASSVLCHGSLYASMITDKLQSTIHTHTEDRLGFSSCGSARVHHAHQRGINPSVTSTFQVFLVTHSLEGVTTPMVIDFGVARKRKSHHDSVDRQNGFHCLREFLLATPAYMSPEHSASYRGRR